MSPRKQPDSLFKTCIKKCISLIYSACNVIELKIGPDNNFLEIEEQAFQLKCHLMSMLPAR